MSPSHRCQVREVSAETGPSIPGRGVRSKLAVCPTRLSTSIDPHAGAVRDAQGLPMDRAGERCVDRLMYACVGAGIPAEEARQVRSDAGESQGWLSVPHLRSNYKPRALAWGFCFGAHGLGAASGLREIPPPRGGEAACVHSQREP